MGGSGWRCFAAHKLLLLGCKHQNWALVRDRHQGTGSAGVLHGAPGVHSTPPALPGLCCRTVTGAGTVPWSPCWPPAVLASLRFPLAPSPGPSWLPGWLLALALAPKGATRKQEMLPHGCCSSRRRPQPQAEGHSQAAVVPKGGEAGCFWGSLTLWRPRGCQARGRRTPRG